jgi:hypothetical protein
MFHPLNNQNASTYTYTNSDQHTHPDQYPLTQHQPPNPTTTMSHLICRTLDDSSNWHCMLPESSRILCYVDASTHPDYGLSHQRSTGLGIFVVNLQIHPTNYIYIRATLQETHSVIFPEAAAIALAVVVLHRLGLNQVDFHSDSATCDAPQLKGSPLSPRLENVSPHSDVPRLH